MESWESESGTTAACEGAGSAENFKKSRLRPKALLKPVNIQIKFSNSIMITYYQIGKKVLLQQNH